MSVTEAERPAPVPAQRSLFGQITLEDMRGNELLTKTVMPLVGEVCKHSKGKFTPVDVADGLLSGVYKLWGVMRPPASLDAVVVTRVDGDAFELLLLGPNFREIFQFLPQLQRMGRIAGCKRIRLEGPPSWRRDLGEGWKASPIVYEKAI